MFLRRVTIALIGLALSGLAGAQSYNAFQSANLQGVIVQPSNVVAGVPQTYFVSLTSTPTLDGNPITLLWGFYRLGATSADNVSATGTPDEFNWKFNGSKPNFAGWEDAPKFDAISPTGNPHPSLTFTFSNLSGNLSSDYGFHFSYVQNGTVQTGFFRGNAVPEPATMLTIGLGVAALIRRRRKTA